MDDGLKEKFWIVTLWTAGAEVCGGSEVGPGASDGLVVGAGGGFAAGAAAGVGDEVAVVP